MTPSVIIMDDNRPRASWRFGRIVKIIESGDRQVRSVNVVVVSNGRLNIIRYRHVNKLMSVDYEVVEGIDDVDGIGDVQIEVVR